VRLSIERMRTLILVAAALLIAAVCIVLVAGKWRSPFSGRDIPKRLGINIQQEANGVTYTQSHGGHTIFKIHASREVQLKSGHAQLHDVEIELYGADGARVDRISGDEFEYDQQSGVATAAGPVEITLMRPGVAPIAPTLPSGAPLTSNNSLPQPARAPAAGTPLANASEAAEKSNIHVKTSGITFNQKTGLVTTSNRVEFSTGQGSGASVGASYDSSSGHLALEHEVQINALRGTEPVTIHADHAEFDRDTHLSHLRAATAAYRGGQAAAAQAEIHFRDDGSAVRLDATGGFTLTTETGSHLAAPVAHLEFNEHNKPRDGRLEGGVTMDSVSGDSASGSRTLHAGSPTAQIEFTSQGRLRRAHFERGVEMRSIELTAASTAGAEPLRLARTWHSPVAELDFRNSAGGQAELASMHGTEGVVLTGESQRGSGPAARSRLAADEVTGAFGPGSSLQSMTGSGHASLQQTTAAGALQTAAGDRLQARFVPSAAAKPASTGADPLGSTQLDWAQLDGDVVLLQQPASTQQANSSASAALQASSQQPLRATAGRAVYQSQGESLRLTVNPRVRDGGMELSSDSLDISRQSNEAFARGNVKATWISTSTNSINSADSGSASQPASNSASQPAQASSRAAGETSSGISLGGRGPAHVVATEAELDQANGRATFRGHARLWQQTSSIAAPVIVLDRRQQTLTAETKDPADPVRVVLVSAGSSAPGLAQSSTPSSSPATPSLIRIRGGDLRYSAAERRAQMRAGVLSAVTSQTPTATAASDQIELFLIPVSQQAKASALSQSTSEAQVDHLIASGHVVLASQDRRGTGDQLVYTGSTGDYVLTGTASAPPHITDPVRGSVTGQTLIFRSRDDSVSIEGGGRATAVETTAPR
jgi:lipopolysaccharide export system protein LptA